MNYPQFVENSRIKLLIKSLTKERDSFFRDEIIDLASKNNILNHSVDRFLNEQRLSGNYKRSSKSNGRRGRPRSCYTVLKVHFINICEKCIENIVFFYCTHCGKKICNHHAHLVSGLQLCPKCSDNLLFCPGCLKQLLIGVHIEEDYIKGINYLVMVEEEGDIQHWYCPNDFCDHFGNRKTKEMLEIVYRLINLEEIELMREYYQDLIEEENHFQKLRKQFLTEQGELMKECELENSCIADVCPLQEVSGEERYFCPSGLPGWEPECYYCDECEYLYSYPDLTPHDEEFTDFGCKFFDIISPEDEESEWISHNEENVEI